MASSFVRGTQTMNSMFFKPMVRKAYHKKSSSPDMMPDTVKLEAEEVKNKPNMKHVGESDSNNVWVPHERTGIYYPKGHEKVLEDVPPVATKEFGVNWFSYNDEI